MTQSEHIPPQRLEKLENLRGRGIDPYPAHYQRTHTAKQAIALLEQQEIAPKANVVSITVAGRIIARRSMGAISFMDIRDGSGKIQLLIDGQFIDEETKTLLENLDIGDIVGADGVLFRTKRGEPTVKAASLTLLSKSLLPLPEKWHGLQDTEKRYRQRYLDLIANPEVREVFRKRSQVISAMRDFLNQHGFLEVETPILQPSAGGALARPFITHHNALDCNFYLRIALELHLKRLIVGGFDRVYEIGRVFRNEGISTKHNPEFTMLESYQAYADYNDVMRMLEEMVSSVVKHVSGNYKVPYAEGVIDFTPPWCRLGLRQAIMEYSGIDYSRFPDTASLQAEMQRQGIEFDPKRDRGRLIDDLISTFVEPKLLNPTFLVDYPIDMSPLAKNKPGDERTVERFEAFAGYMEIANAFTELNDPLEQERRFAKQMEGRPSACRPDDEEVWAIDEDFLTTLEYGMPPTGGLGVGVDRIVMLVTNQQSIREVILFPALKERE